MNAPAATRDGAILALVLADALKLGLPCPDYITVSPPYASSESISAISFQFNHRHGQEPLPAMQAWADRFGVAVKVSTDSEKPDTTWHEFDFTHAGVRFHVYASIEAAEPEPDVTDYCGATTVDEEGDQSYWTCEREAGHTGSHHVHWDGGGIAWSDEHPEPLTGRDVLLSALADDTTGSAA